MTRAEIEKAIVTLTKRGGQGVLVADNRDSHGCSLH